MSDYKVVPVELIDPAAHLLSEAHKYWKHANAHHCGAVQWIEDHETGALLIFTRGEYREILMQNIVRLRRAEQPAPDVAGLIVLLEHAQCPNCDGSGAFYDGHGQVCQCQWCHERDEVLAAHRKQGGEV